MRILIISDEYPPFRGGIASYARAIRDQFERHGHRVDVITCGPDGQTPQPADRSLDDHADDSLTGTIWRFSRPSTRVLRAAYLLVAWPLRTSVHLRRHPYDRIIVVDPANALTMPLVRRLSGISYDVVLHGSELLRYPRRRLVRRLFQQALRRATKIYSNTTYTNTLLSEFAQADGIVSSCGANDLFFRQPANQDKQRMLKERYRLDDADFVIGTVGRLDERKGHDVVLAALSDVIAKYPRVKYLVGGCGPREAALRRQADRLCLADHVHFTGLIAEDELVDHYDLLDLFVMPNRVTPTTVEGFGITFVEAAARGVPSVGVNNGGVRDAIDDGNSGWLLSEPDPDELSGLLVEILEGRKTIDAAAAQTHAAKFSWERVAERFFQ